MKNAWKTYSAIDHFHVNVSLFGPFVPEVWVIQRDVCTITRCYKTSLKLNIKIIFRTSINFWLQSSVLVYNKNRLSCFSCAELFISLITDLGKCGPSSFRLNGDGLCPSLEDLINVLFTELCPFIFLIHDCPICTTLQQILNLSLW